MRLLNKWNVRKGKLFKFSRSGLFSWKKQFPLFSLKINDNSPFFCRNVMDCKIKGTTRSSALSKIVDNDFYLVKIKKGVRYYSESAVEEEEDSVEISEEEEEPSEVELEDSEKNKDYKEYFKDISEKSYMAYKFLRDKAIQNVACAELERILSEYEKNPHIKLTPPFWSCYVRSVFIQKGKATRVSLQYQLEDKLPCFHLLIQVLCIPCKSDHLRFLLQSFEY